MKEKPLIKVKDIMNQNIITITEQTSIVEAAKLMTKHNIGFLPILNNDKLVGVITDRDIIKNVINKEKDIYAAVKIAMTTNTITVNKNDDISIAITKMANNQIRRIIVIDKNRIVGIISISDISNNIHTNIYLKDLMTEILLEHSHTPFLSLNSSIKI